MANKKISELPLGLPAATSVVPVSDAAGTITNKVTIQSILESDSRWNVFKPGPCTNLSTAGGDSQASLSWTPPVAPLAQVPIIDYVVQYSADSGATWTTFAHSPSVTAAATVTALANGTAYVFRVAAVNAVGAGAYSSASNPVTPLGVPGVPTAVSASPGNARAALSWTAPVNTGGTAITDYLVEYSADSGVTWSQWTHSASTATSATLTGLTNGSAYIFRVSAINATGSGGASSSTRPITPDSITLPGAPTALSATANASQLVLAWTAPADNGGTTLTGYIIRYTPSGGIANTVNTGSTSASFVLTGLSNGTAYSVAVAAINAVGTGSYSDTASGTPVAAPDAPTNVSASAGNAEVALTWSAPSRTGGSAITDYAIQYSSDSGTTWSTWSHTVTTATSATVSGLINGTAYVFRIAAVNAVGTGTYSSSGAAVAPSAAPALTLTRAAGVSWSGAGTPASPYTYSGSIDDGTAADAANGLKFTVTQKGIFYFSTSYYDSPDDNASGVRILKNGGVAYSGSYVNGGTLPASTSFAVNPGDVVTFPTNRSYWGSGGSYTNTSVYLAPFPVIGVPTGLTTTGGDAQVALSWIAPSSNASVITDYTIEYSWNNGATWQPWTHTASTSTTATITGLWNGIAYLFRVKGIGTAGQDSQYATSVSVAPNGTANASVQNSFVVVNYTSGAWNGTDTIASGSTFGPMNNTTLPFTIAALTATDVTIAHRHQNATADDNHGRQSVYYRVNGTNLEFSQTQSVIAADASARIRLNAGETLALFVTGSASYNSPTDTYTNISIAAAVPTAPKLVPLSLLNFGSWTGDGTVSNKLSSTSFTRSVSQGNGPIFYAAADCAVFVSATVSTIPDDNDSPLFVNRPNGSRLLAIDEGATQTKSSQLSRGQVVFMGNSGMTVSNLQVWST